MKSPKVKPPTTQDKAALAKVTANKRDYSSVFVPPWSHASLSLSEAAADVKDISAVTTLSTLSAKL